MKDFRNVERRADGARASLGRADVRPYYSAAAGAGQTPETPRASRALIGRVLQVSGLSMVAIGILLQTVAPATVPEFVTSTVAPLLVALGFVEFVIGRTMRRVAQKTAATGG